jgi:DNA-binding CsgD family transcriptional regulator
MNPDFDPITLIERGYEARPDVARWLEDMAAPVAANIDPNQIGVQFWFQEGARSVSEHGWLPGTNSPFRSAAASRAFGAQVLESMSSADAQRMLSVLGIPGLHTLRDGFKEPLAEFPAVGKEFGVRDSAAVVIPASDGRVAVISSLLRASPRLDAALTAVWRRIASHLGAGLRLSGRASSPAAADVECVLAPNGTVLHAKGSARGDYERDRLRTAVRDVERARSRRMRSDPYAALELWRGLFSGRWSLVDHFDADGRRFFLARRNDPRLPDLAGLPLRQRQVVFFVAAGWSNKEVGYALGIGTTTVAAHLGRALRQLGVHSRAELIRISSELSAAAATPQ